MRKTILFVAALAAASTLALPAAAATTVNVGDNYFVRPSGVPTVYVARGARATFRWIGRRPHNVKGVRINLGTTCARTRSTGSCVTLALTRPGLYTAYCQIHGAADMSMKIRVR